VWSVAPVSTRSSPSWAAEHAQPGALVQASFDAMHVLPHGLLFVHTLQQLDGAVASSPHPPTTTP
jgi:hypothetical protein